MYATVIPITVYQSIHEIFTQNVCTVVVSKLLIFSYEIFKDSYTYLDVNVNKTLFQILRR